MSRKPTPPATKLGRDVRDRRAALGLGQVRAAEVIGVPDTTLSRVERGTHAPSVDTAMAIARWLDCPMEQVIVAARTPASAVC